MIKEEYVLNYSVLHFGKFWQKTFLDQLRLGMLLKNMATKVKFRSYFVNLNQSNQLLAEFLLRFRKGKSSGIGLHGSL